MNLLRSVFVFGNSTNSELCSRIDFTKSCSFIHFVGKQKILEEHAKASLNQNLVVFLSSLHCAITRNQDSGWRTSHLKLAPPVQPIRVMNHSKMSYDFEGKQTKLEIKWIGSNLVSRFLCENGWTACTAINLLKKKSSIQSFSYLTSIFLLGFVKFTSIDKSPLKYTDESK